MQADRHHRSRETLLPLLLFAIICALYVIHVRLVHFVCDDAYITFRYAANLAGGEGPVYNPGERVEGYTNFLWMALIAAAMKGGATPERASFVLGVISFLAAAAGTAALARRLTGPHPAWPLLPALLLASLGPVVLWSVCGLETVAFAAAVTAAIVAVHPKNGGKENLFCAGLLYGVASLLRPEGVIFAGAAGIVIVAGIFDGNRRAAWETVRRAVRLAGGFAVAFLPFLLWRRAWYGDWLPNTFYVKAGGMERIGVGIHYLLSFAREYPAVVVFALGGIVLGFLDDDTGEQRARRRLLSHITLAALLYTVYVIRVGGDYMALYRFIVPILPLTAVLGAVALHRSYSLLRTTTREPFAMTALVAVTAAFAAASFEPSTASARGERRSDIVVPLKVMKTNTAVWIAAGKALRARSWPDAVIATTAAGALPFYSGLETIDQSGLNDRHTARVEWDRWLENKPGHGKRATRAYILKRSPDMIIGHPRVALASEIGVETSPWPRYILRSIPIDNLPGGGDAAETRLFFWLRRDLARRGEEHGFLPPGRPSTGPPGGDRSP